MSFVARQNIQGMIVGVNKSKELEEILSVWELFKKPKHRLRHFGFIR